MDSTALNDIQNRARLLARLYPDNAQRLIKARQGFAYVETWSPAWESTVHECNAWDATCREAREMANALALLVYKHLPDFQLEYIRVHPEWRYDDEATDWEAIKSELRRIEDAAIRALVAAADTATLSPSQEAIYESLTADYQTAEKIAKTAGYEVELVRRELPNLKRMGLVDHKPRTGYRRK